MKILILKYFVLLCLAFGYSLAYSQSTIRCGGINDSSAEFNILENKFRLVGPKGSLVVIERDNVIIPRSEDAQNFYFTYTYGNHSSSDNGDIKVSISKSQGKGSAIWNHKYMGRAIFQESLNCAYEQDTKAQKFVDASCSGNFELVEAYLEGRTLDVNFRGKQGDTALICAARNSRWNIVSAIIFNEYFPVNFELKSSIDGSTFFHHLESFPQLEFEKILPLLPDEVLTQTDSKLQTVFHKDWSLQFYLLILERVPQNVLLLKDSVNKTVMDYASFDWESWLIENVPELPLKVNRLSYLSEQFFKLDDMEGKVNYQAWQAFKLKRPESAHQILCDGLKYSFQFGRANKLVTVLLWDDPKKVQLFDDIVTSCEFSQQELKTYQNADLVDSEMRFLKTGLSLGKANLCFPAVASSGDVSPNTLAILKKYDLMNDACQRILDARKASSLYRTDPKEFNPLFNLSIDRRKLDNYNISYYNSMDNLLIEETKSGETRKFSYKEYVSKWLLAHRKKGEYTTSYFISPSDLPGATIVDKRIWIVSRINEEEFFVARISRVENFNPIFEDETTVRIPPSQTKYDYLLLPPQENQSQWIFMDGISTTWSEIEYNSSGEGAVYIAHSDTTNKNGEHFAAKFSCKKLFRAAIEKGQAPFLADNLFLEGDYDIGIIDLDILLFTPDSVVCAVDSLAFQRAILVAHRKGNEFVTETVVLSFNDDFITTPLQLGRANFSLVPRKH